MIYKINKKQIIEEANVASTLLMSGKMVEAVKKQNDRLGPDHKTTKTNLAGLKKRAVAQQG